MDGGSLPLMAGSWLPPAAAQEAARAQAGGKGASPLPGCQLTLIHTDVSQEALSVWESTGT